MMPINLVLIRHGESEGNAAKRRSEAGDDSAFTDEFRSRHSADYRLSDKGRQQAILAGEFLRQEFTPSFSKFFVSGFVRAMQTAALLSLPDANWFQVPYLVERDWGELDVCPISERQERFADAMRRRDTEPFFWTPPNGESYMQVCLRVDRFLDTLHRECHNKTVVVVCHGEVIRAFRMRLERMSPVEFRRMVASEALIDRIHNCEVLHYTRVDPDDGDQKKHLRWLRRARPSEGGTWWDWQEIVRKGSTNEELLEICDVLSGVTQ